MSYILISAIKNEEENLSDLYNSVCAQTILPLIWVIVNDGSTDGSKDILDKKFKDKNFIHVVHLEESPRSLLKVYKILQIGIELALNLLNQNNQKWEYLGILDGDIIIPKNYYETLMKKFDTDNILGIISGKILSFNGKVYKERYAEINKPGNAARLISRKCYELIGFPISPAGDSIMNIYAKNRGFKTIFTDDTYAYQKRLTNSALGYWKSHLYVGRLKYYIGCTPIYAIIYTIKLLMTYPFFHSFSFLSGYFISFLKKDNRINDLEVYSYYNNLVKNKIIEKYNRCFIKPIIRIIFLLYLLITLFNIY